MLWRDAYMRYNMRGIYLQVLPHAADEKKFDDALELVESTYDADVFVKSKQRQSICDISDTVMKNAASRAFSNMKKESEKTRSK